MQYPSIKYYGGHICPGLSRRGVVAVAGAEAEAFLNGIVTNDLADIPAGSAGYGGLLTPQGKILFDFIVYRDGERFLFDLPAAAVADFVKRLGFYRLRAQVEITVRIVPGCRCMGQRDSPSRRRCGCRRSTAEIAGLSSRGGYGQFAFRTRLRARGRTRL